MMEVFDSKGRRYSEDEFAKLRQLIEEPVMQAIHDLEHFVLAEGETLILRCTRAISNDELVAMRGMLEKYLPGRPVIVLPPDIEMCAGKLEVWGTPTVDEEATAAELERHRRDTIHRNYDNGRMVYARDAEGEVFVVQRAAYPHTIDFDRFTYALTEKELRQ